VRGTTVAVCMIVRDEEATIERCLASLRPFVDEVNVYDTGSTDGTLGLLERLAREDGPAPLRVCRGEWRDDFSWARNQSFAMASRGMEWLVWADADDTVVGGTALRGILGELPDDVDALVCAYDTALDEDDRPRVRAWRERAVRSRAGFTWRGAVHERLALPARVQRRARRADPQRLCWLHRPVGPWAPERNRAILAAQAELSEAAGEPPDAHVLFYLGYELYWHGDFDAARPLLRRWLDLYASAWSDEALAVANRLAACHRFAGELAAAAALEQEAFAARPGWLPTAVGLAQTSALAQRWDETIAWCERALSLPLPESGVPLPVLELTLLPRLRLAEAQLSLAREEEARAAVRGLVSVADAGPWLRERLERFESHLDDGAHTAALAELRACVSAFDETMRSALRGLQLEARRRQACLGAA
jgi:tetratricopeptide (TPR) repeat protein